jgi:hypothetical protein
MQKPFEHTLSPESRTAISTSLIAAIAYCSAIVIACVLLSFASPRAPDSQAQVTRDAIPDIASGRPL